MSIVIPNETEGEFSVRMAQAFGSSDASRSIFSAVAHADRDKKGEILRDMVKEIGGKDFKCPALEQFISRVF
jgi:hypothetical protein